MIDYEIKAAVLGVHPEHGELISASAAKEVIAHFQSQLAKANERVAELSKALEWSTSWHNFDKHELPCDYELWMSSRSLLEQLRKEQE